MEILRFNILPKINLLDQTQTFAQLWTFLDKEKEKEIKIKTTENAKEITEKITEETTKEEETEETTKEEEYAEETEAAKKDVD